MTGEGTSMPDERKDRLERSVVLLRYVLVLLEEVGRHCKEHKSETHTLMVHCLVRNLAADHLQITKEVRDLLVCCEEEQVAFGYKEAI